VCSFFLEAAAAAATVVLRTAAASATFSLSNQSTTTNQHRLSLCFSGLVVGRHFHLFSRSLSSFLSPQETDRPTEDAYSSIHLQIKRRMHEEEEEINAISEQFLFSLISILILFHQLNFCLSLHTHTRYLHPATVYLFISPSLTLISTTYHLSLPPSLPPSLLLTPQQEEASMVHKPPPLPPSLPPSLPSSHPNRQHVRNYRMSSTTNHHLFLPSSLPPSLPPSLPSSLPHTPMGNK